MKTTTSLTCLLGMMASAGVVQGQECGNFFTSECVADYDVRYNPAVPVDLPSQAQAWSDIPGLYQGQIYQYDPVTFTRLNTTGFFDTSAGQNQYQLSPSVFYLNITVNGTRAYRHSYQIMAGRLGLAIEGDAAMPGGVKYCDGWSVATWEKSGIAQNLASVCNLGDAYDSAKVSPPIKLLAGSLAYPVDEESGVLFVEQFYPNNDASLPLTRMDTTYLCTNQDCSSMAVRMETYENGKRTEFQMGDVVRISNSTVFQQRITQDYVTYFISEGDQVIQPMQSSCLNTQNCATNQEFCQSGDPSCTVTPYTEPTATVKTGSIVTLVFGIVAFFLLLVMFLFWYLTRLQSLRYHAFFALRMAETMDTKIKTILEFAPEELANEYKMLVKHCNNEINKDNLYEFLSSGPHGLMDYGDFEALWTRMNSKRTGVVDFLEFSSIMAHCHKEIEEAKGQLNEEEQGLVHGESTEE